MLHTPDCLVLSQQLCIALIAWYGSLLFLHCLPMYSSLSWECYFFMCYLCKPAPVIKECLSWRFLSLFRPVLLLPVLILPLEFNLEYKMSIVMLIRRIHLKSQRRSLRATNPISAIKMLKVRLKSRNLELNLQNSKFKLEFAAFKILRRKSIITAFKTGLLSLRPLS